MRYCEIPVSEITQDVFDVTINNSLDSCIINNDTDIAIVAWEGKKQHPLYGRTEVSEDELETLITTHHNGWTTPFEMTWEEANHFPDNVLEFLSYTPDEIEAIRNA